MPNNSPQSGSQACAACKYQRRKCAPNCTLAPYFPPERTNDFLNAHKLFGISKITKTLDKVPPFARQNTVKCMVFEANTRSKDRVGGCYRIVCELQNRIIYAEAELDLVLRQLAVARAQHGIGNPSPNPDPNPSPSLRFCDMVQNQNQNQHPRVGVGVANPNTNASLSFSDTVWPKVGVGVGVGVDVGVYDDGIEKINNLGLEGMEFPVVPIRGVKVDTLEASCSYGNKYEECDDKKPGIG